VQPVISTLNALKGQVVANADIVPAGIDGAISVFVTDAGQVIIDTTAILVGNPVNRASCSPCHLLIRRIKSILIRRIKSILIRRIKSILIRRIKSIY
jgi:hypothetical protein